MPKVSTSACHVSHQRRSRNTVVISSAVQPKLGSSESERHTSRDSSTKSPKLASQGHSEEPRSTTSGESSENYPPATMKTVNIPIVVPQDYSNPIDFKLHQIIIPASEATAKWVMDILVKAFALIFREQAEAKGHWWGWDGCWWEWRCGCRLLRDLWKQLNS